MKHTDDDITWLDLVRVYFGSLLLGVIFLFVIKAEMLENTLSGVLFTIIEIAVICWLWYPFEKDRLPKNNNEEDNRFGNLDKKCKNENI